MKRQKHRQPDEAQLNVDIPQSLLDEVIGYAVREKVTRKLVVETALRRFLVSEKALKAEQRMRAK